jgi:hypothetical protein
MILEGADCTFRSIAALDSGRYQLVGDVFGRHELLEDGESFVVKALELGAKASFA